MNLSLSEDLHSRWMTNCSTGAPSAASSADLLGAFPAGAFSVTDSEFPLPLRMPEPGGGGGMHDTLSQAFDVSDVFPSLNSAHGNPQPAAVGDSSVSPSNEQHFIPPSRVQVGKEGQGLGFAGFFPVPFGAAGLAAPPSMAAAADAQALVPFPPLYNAVYPFCVPSAAKVEGDVINPYSSVAHDAKDASFDHYTVSRDSKEFSLTSPHTSINESPFHGLPSEIKLPFPVPSSDPNNHHMTKSQSFLPLHRSCLSPNSGDDVVSDKVKSEKASSGSPDIASERAMRPTKRKVAALEDVPENDDLIEYTNAGRIYSMIIVTEKSPLNRSNKQVLAVAIQRLAATRWNVQDMRRVAIDVTDHLELPTIMKEKQKPRKGRKPKRPRLTPKTPLPEVADGQNAVRVTVMINFLMSGEEENAVLQDLVEQDMQPSVMEHLLAHMLATQVTVFGDIDEQSLMAVKSNKMEELEHYCEQQEKRLRKKREKAARDRRAAKEMKQRNKKAKPKPKPKQ